MRMQNADMEFVTFDAQDVIATSGFGFSMYVSGDIITAYNKLLDTPKEKKLSGGTTGRYYLFYTTADGDTSGLFQHEIQYSSEDGLKTTDQFKKLTDNGKHVIKLESVNDIVAWVAANSIQ